MRYDTISERYELIPEAYKKTFEWILQRQETESIGHGGDDFVQWLRMGEGIFWINGKAGSGKSTLMKYIHDHPMMQQHLLTWANHIPLYTTEFFFWLGGTRIQKSQEGLLSSLLHQVLSQMLSLIPRVFPSQWEARYATKTNITKTRPVRALIVPLSDLLAAK